MVFTILNVHEQGRKIRQACGSSLSDCAVRIPQMLRIMFLVMPSRHPWLPLQVVPVIVPCVYRSVVPSDPNCAVTGNLVSEFGALKKATLQRSKRKKMIILAGGGSYLKAFKESKADGDICR